MILVCLALLCGAGCAGVYTTEEGTVFGYALGEAAILVEDECATEEGEKDVAVDGAGISEHLYKLFSGILQAFFKVAP